MLCALNALTYMYVRYDVVDDNVGDDDVDVMEWNEKYIIE